MTLRKNGVTYLLAEWDRHEAIELLLLYPHEGQREYNMKQAL